MDSASYEVHEALSGQRFHYAEGQPLLQVMEQRGKRCMPVGCAAAVAGCAR